MIRRPQSLRLFSRTTVRGVTFRRLAILVVLLGVMAIGGLSMFGVPAPSVSSLWKIPALDSTPGGNRQRESEQYQETVRTANDQNITRAVAEGSSHLPIPESIPEGRMTEQSGGTLPWMHVGSGTPPPLPAIDRTERSEATRDPLIPMADESPDPVPAAATARLDAALGVVHTIDVTDGIPAEPAPLPPARSNPGPRPIHGSPPAPSASKPPPVHQQERLEAYEEIILAQMGTIAAGMTIGPMSGRILIEEGLPSAGSRGGAPVTEVDADEARNRLRIRAGEVLYGSMLLAADSETPTPVVARIESGELAGARLIGSFTPAERTTGLIITFRTLVDPQGQDHAINAFAIDGVSGAGSVASHIDRRILARYGPILAASFLAGLAQSAGTPRTVLLNGDGTPTLVEDAPTMTESLYAGLAAAANQAQQDIIKTRPRGPRVIVAAGHPVGILFLETVVLGTG